MNELCHTYQRVSHDTRANEPCHTYEWVIAHVWMSHGTHMIESWHTYDWVMAHIWLSHGTHMIESCHAYQRVIDDVWMGHVTHMMTYEWVMSHISRPRFLESLFYFEYPLHSRHVTHVHESYYAYEQVMVMSRSSAGHDMLVKGHVTHYNISWHRCEWVMSRTWLCHDTATTLQHTGSATFMLLPHVPLFEC